MNARTKIEPPPQVYTAISDVMAHMAKEGIGKGRKNAQQGYNFRGIDDVYNALSSVLAANRLVMLPFVQDMQREERQTKGGGLLNYTILTVDFDLVSAVDGSKHTVRTIGEAMDSADKSSNKAQSAALKYAALEVFMIPTEGDNDADATTHEVASSQMPDTEYDKLVHLVGATKSNVPALLKYLAIKVPNDNLRALNQSQYGQVLDALNDKLAKMAKEQTAASAKEMADA